MKKQGSKKKKILIIEDDFDLMWMINKLLALHDYEVLTAVTGSQGFEYFDSHNTSLNAVILDLSLPDADGEQIVYKIFEKSPKMPVIVTSGNENLEQRKRLIDSGVDAYLLKPFDLTRLIDKLQEL